MSRIVLAITVAEDEVDAVENQIDKVLREYRYKLQRFELEDGDELLKLSVAKEGIVEGLKTWIDNALTSATPEARYARQLAEEMASYQSPPEDLPGISESAGLALEALAKRREELAAERARELAERNAREQEERRQRFAELDRAADEARRVRQAAKADSGCPGGCSRGGEGPACGRPGCY